MVGNTSAAIGFSGTASSGTSLTRSGPPGTPPRVNWARFCKVRCGETLFTSLP
jgi:hypothetical protein